MPAGGGCREGDRDQHADLSHTIQRGRESTKTAPSVPSGCYLTTGTAGFPECQLHSGKAQLHSGKPSPSATLGEEPPANPFTGKSPSPSVKNRALGVGFAECRAGTRGRLDAVGRWPTSFSFSFSFSFLIFFPECNTRERFLNFF